MLNLLTVDREIFAVKNFHILTKPYLFTPAQELPSLSFRSLELCVCMFLLQVYIPRSHTPIGYIMPTGPAVAEFRPHVGGYYPRHSPPPAAQFPVCNYTKPGCTQPPV